MNKLITYLLFVNLKNMLDSVFSSLVAPAIVAAIISYLTSKKIVNLEYKNEFYKKILDKRLRVYGYLEGQVAVLKSIVSDDGEPYHQIFAYGDNDFYNYTKTLKLAMAYNLWMTDNTVKLIKEMDNLFYKVTKEMEPIKEYKDGEIFIPRQSSLVEIGQMYYHEISKIRLKLEISVRDDLLKLHDIKDFRRHLIRDND